MASRDISDVWYTGEELALMRKYYSANRINVFAFIGDEHPYIPLFLRLGLPAIATIRTVLHEVDHGIAVNDDNQFRFITLLLHFMRERVLAREVIPGTFPTLLWPLIEHNIPEMRTISSDLPENNCVFARFTIAHTGDLSNSIYINFSKSTLEL